MEKTSPQPEDAQATVTIINNAVAEFKRDGRVSTVHCDVCGSLIELQWLGSNQTALSIKCICGKFHGNLRGLL
jgi:hypothetical protein